MTKPTTRKPRPLKKRAKRLSTARLRERAARRKRATDAISKRSQRHKDAQKVKEQREIDNARCVDLEALRKKCVAVESRPGCWVWTGRFQPSWGVPRPVASAGQYGRMPAARAMWKALGRRGLERTRNYPKASCGYADCIAPDHLQLTNQYRELAKLGLVRELQEDRARAERT